MQQRDITTVHPYPDNAKLHPDKQVAQIAKSIEAFGFNQPVVVDKQGFIIVGHGRYLAAKMLGLSVIPVIEVHLDDEKTRAYRLADNKLNESDWDMELVIEELRGLSMPMLELTGFDKDLIIESDDRDDKIPTNAPTRAQVGDLWALGSHRVLCGDATKADDLARLFAIGTAGEHKADMVFTDPPYNVDYTGKTDEALKIQNDKKDDTKFYTFLLSAFRNMARHTKQGGAAYICHADWYGHIFRQAFMDAGFLLKQCIIWNKNSMVLSRQDYHWKHEPILYGWQSGGSHSWYGPRNQTTVWDVKRPSRSEEHPTMKPVELITNALTNSSKEEDIILDPFLGSGSTLIACEKTGRICYGLELDPKYMDVLISRWEVYTGLKATKV